VNLLGTSTKYFINDTLQRWFGDNHCFCTYFWNFWKFYNFFGKFFALLTTIPARIVVKSRTLKIQRRLPSLKVNILCGKHFAPFSFSHDFFLTLPSFSHCASFHIASSAPLPAPPLRLRLREPVERRRPTTRLRPQPSRSPAAARPM